MNQKDKLVIEILNKLVAENRQMKSDIKNLQIDKQEQLTSSKSNKFDEAVNVIIIILIILIVVIELIVLVGKV